jgi:hypothetical protein
LLKMALNTIKQTKTTTHSSKIMYIFNNHIMLYTSPWSRFELTTLVVIGTDFIGSCKFNYHTITATTARNNDLLSIVATSSLFTLSVIPVFLYKHEQTTMIYFHLSCPK